MRVDVKGKIDIDKEIVKVKDRLQKASEVIEKQKIIDD